jgi:hypothetical protein
LRAEVTTPTETAPAAVRSRPAGALLLERQASRLEPIDPRSLDFQARVGRPVDALEDGAQTCVLVLTRSSDLEMDELSLRLAADGVPLVRLDSDLTAGAVCLEPGRAVVCVDGERFAPVASWRRYFSAESLPPSGDLVLDRYCQTQWTPWAAVVAGLRGVRTINRGGGSPGLDRVSQLATAEAAGLEVPPTVVSNDLAAAARLLPGARDLVVKGLGAHCLETAPGHFHGLFPQLVARAEAAGMADIEPAPVMIQAYVESRRELRVFVIGRELVAFQVSKPTPDAFWRDPDSIRIEQAPVPRSLRLPLLELARRWRLDVAAFDVLDASPRPNTPAEPRDWVFLEVNVSCDWLVFERSARCAVVSERVSELVARHYRARRRPLATGVRRCA